MSSRSWQERVHDILESIYEICDRSEGLSFEEFSQSRTVIKAILYDFMIIGEAARNIPPEIQALAPELPWRLMADMRNVMAHEYFQVDLEIVWTGIQSDLPLVIQPLQNLLAQATDLDP